MPLKKNNTTMKKNLVKKNFKKGGGGGGGGKLKAIEGRICRKRSNNAMLKRTEEKAVTSVKSHGQKLTSGIFVKQMVFLMVNHRGLLPLRELPSTGETIVFRGPEGSWACLPSVHKCITLPQSVTHVDYTLNSTLRREEPQDSLKRPKSQEENLGCG